MSLITSIPVALSVLAHAQAASLPLVVTRMSIATCKPDPAAEGFPHVEVRNTGQRAILAWAVKFQLTYPDGRVAPGGVGVDTASSLSEQPPGAIAPGATAANNCGGLVVPADTAISAGSVAYVIFDDDTALGDEGEIARVFERRRTRQMFWQRMQAILDEASSATNAAAVLSRIQERMGADTDLTFTSIGDYQWFRNEMSPRHMALTTPQALLDRFRSVIPPQKANADAHAIRR
jgi:hypothetical protein